MQERIISNAISLIIALGALVGAIWTLLSGQIQSQGVDGLFLFLVCLLMVVIFSWNPVRYIRRGEWKKLFHHRKAQEAGPEAQRTVRTYKSNSEPSAQS